jgi:hypothetical protein
LAAVAGWGVRPVRPASGGGVPMGRPLPLKMLEDLEGVIAATQQPAPGFVRQLRGRDRLALAARGARPRLP